MVESPGPSSFPVHNYRLCALFASIPLAARLARCLTPDCEGPLGSGLEFRNFVILHSAFCIQKSYNSTGRSTGGSTGKNSESLGKTEALPGSRVQQGRCGVWPIQAPTLSCTLSAA